jgi:SnoaL-like domain
MIKGEWLAVVALMTLPVAAGAKPNYASDRAEIEELQARYMFALDWFDADAYAGTFTEDGTLNWARGTVTGRDAIRKEVQGMRAALAPYYGDDGSGKPVHLRHIITNISIQIKGDAATGNAYWFEMSNNAPGHTIKVGGFSHYEDTLRRVKSHWLFASRKIYNEQLEGRGAGPTNPVRAVGEGK